SVGDWARGAGIQFWGTQLRRGAARDEGEALRRSGNPVIGSSESRFHTTRDTINHKGHEGSRKNFQVFKLTNFGNSGTCGNSSVSVAGVDEGVYIFVQLVALFVIYVHHVPGLIVSKADVLTYGRLQIHVIYGMFNAIERRGYVVITAHHQQF